MKKSILLSFFTLVSLSGFASNEQNNINTTKDHSIEKTKTNDTIEDDFRDCNVKIKTTVQGVKVDLEVTLTDVSLGDCLLFKARIKAAEALL